LAGCAGYGFRVALIALLATVALASCGGSSDDSSGGGGGSVGSGSTKLTLVAYSTPEEAYKELIPAFNKTSAGKGVSFTTSYAASGEQSRAVEGGLPADVVEFSLEPDMTRLVDADLVDSSWNQNQHHGFVTDSVVVLVVRKGNPKHIQGWDDLLKPGVEVVTPNPFSSGAAKWNLLGAYQHGGLRRSARAGQERGSGAGLPDQAVRPRAGARQERARVAADVHERQGRRPALV
jgi:ABC-type sulfate transport system substrate-binding protein